MPEKIRNNTFIQVRRNAGLSEEFNNADGEISKKGIVQHGPLMGLRYPIAKACGSALTPKLLGTYESELHPFIKQLPIKEYKMIVDIGCAEGFYLIGLGRLIPDIPLIGIDIDPEALQLVEKMAAVNQVKAERLNLHQEFSPLKLGTKLPKRSLLICDCEGFEATVFSKDNLWLWRDSDLLIECHDFILPKITEELAARIETSHLVTTVESVDTDQKISIPQSDVFRRARPEHQLRLVSEGRPTRMRWILARTRSG